DAFNDLARKALGPSGKRLAAVAERVTGVWQLGPGWASSVTAAFVLGTREGASVRGGDLGGLVSAPLASATDVDAAIDAAVASVAALRGVAVSMPAAEGGSGGTVDLAALGEFTENITGKTGVLASAARLILEQLGHAPAAVSTTTDIDTELQDLVTSELGSEWPRVVAPVFDANKAVLFDDRWASAREDLARVWAGDKGGNFTGAGETVATQARWWSTQADAAGKSRLAKRFSKIAEEALDTSAGRWSSDTAVVTGASVGSIAAAVVAELLAGGASVVATTSSIDQKKLAFFKKLYRQHAVHGATLWLVPANMASFADVDTLASWIGSDQVKTVRSKSVLVKAAQQPTLLFPFAAPRVSGDLDTAGGQAEAEMRVLLWSVERLIGALSGIGRDTDLGARLHVVLPGSPNRGMFGGDGAYGEAKAALDAIVTKWKAERTWADRVTLVHAIIGWVRGTGLMGQNDPLVDAVEAIGVETWSTEQMAAKLLRSCDAASRTKAAQAPIELDLTGGLAEANLDMATLARDARAAMTHSVEVASTAATIAALPSSPASPQEIAAIDWPKMKARPEDMVVIVGAAELGPYGSSRTRFEVEVSDQLSAAGVLELAWTTGLVVWESTPKPGWYDVESGDLVPEAEIADRYEDVVRERCGIRTYVDDGSIKDLSAPLMTSVFLDQDLSFVVSSEAEARSFQDAEPERTVIELNGDDWKVTRRAGTEIRVPRRMKLTRTVGGQIPTGFDPKTWGISADMVESVDRVALWNIVATVDAFLGSGFSPAELMRWVHPSRVANTQGTGMGGMSSMHSLYIDTILGEAKQNDILQEALPNVIAAHVVQSYVGSYGAMIHPVAACATTAVSIEEGVDKIKLGKADFVVSGGFDDLSAEGIVGFADMSATADSAVMAAKGIENRYFSRANDRRHGGFVESQGGGTVLLARGDVAARMGLPVLGVIAYVGSFGDGMHTSIPAPGLGALAAGLGGTSSPLAKGLADLGLTADDVTVVSKHDTSTGVNELNESELHERLAKAIGRSDGNPLFVMSQKTLTGHSKGGAAAFQIVGLCQVLAGGVIPPNRSLDCVDSDLAGNDHLVWLREPLALGGFKAGLLTSLGFGHVAGLIAVAHTSAFLASLGAKERADYLARATARRTEGRMHLARSMHGGSAMYERAPGRRFGSDEDAAHTLETDMLIDADARLGEDGVYRAACQ
ncbi:MAG: fatty-acid synthase, partial [Nocardioidaceae bacterium]|nr:fatty-acid synthase [Nocardioidaceae bacterium]